MAGRPVARCFVDSFTCPKQPPGLMLIPAVPPVSRLADNFQVARLGDFGICRGDMDVIVEGSDTTLVCGLPIARQGDAMMHGGTIATGSPTEQDGGGTFRLPAGLKISGDPVFQNKVVRDLFFLSKTTNGKATLDAIAASGQGVTIVSGQDNASAPDDPYSVEHGNPSDTKVDYNPDRLDIYVVCGNKGCVACPPQLNLGHELIHAARWARGGATTDHATEEKSVIGPPYGPKDKNPHWPTENGLRGDLNLPVRTNYDPCDDKGLPPARNRRPGSCAG
jgi:hypothetical protein